MRKHMNMKIMPAPRRGRTPGGRILLLVVAAWIPAQAQAPAQEPASDPVAQALAAPVSLSCQLTPLGRALTRLQESVEVPLVLAAGVPAGPVTLEVTDTPLEEVLRRMLEPLDLGFVPEDGVILVATRSELAARSVVTRSYSILDLISPTDDFPGPAIRRGPRREEMGGGVMFESVDESALEVFDSDMIRDFITSRVAPESWDELPCFLWVEGGVLVVSHTPEVHAEIAALLDEFRKVGSRLVQVEARFYLAAPADLESAGGAADGPLPVLLDATARLRLAERAELVAEVSTVGFNSQRVSLSATREHRYVRDYDLEVAQGSAAYYPVLGSVWEGVALDVRPVLGPDRTDVTLELRLDLVKLSGPLQTRTGTPRPHAVPTGAEWVTAVVGSGSQVEQIPTLDDGVATTIRVPLGQGVLFRATPLLAGDTGRIPVAVVVPRLLE